MKRATLFFLLIWALTGSLRAQIEARHWLVSLRGSFNWDVGGNLVRNSAWSLYASPLYLWHDRWAGGLQITLSGEHNRFELIDRLQTFSLSPVLRHYFPSNESEWAFFVQMDPGWQTERYRFRPGTTVDEDAGRSDFLRISGGIGLNHMLGERIGLEGYVQGQYLRPLSATQGSFVSPPWNFTLAGSLGLVFLLEAEAVRLPEWDDE